MGKPSGKYRISSLSCNFISVNKEATRIQPHFSGLDKGSYGLYQNGTLYEVYDVKGRDAIIKIDLEISGEDFDVVIMRCQ